MSKCHDDSEYKRRKRKNHEEENSRRRRDRQEEHADAEVVQEGVQKSVIDQESDELIWIKDSCNVEVQSTDTQAAVSLQVGLQLAIALVISITIGDSDEAQAVSQELFQHLDSEQLNKQKIFIENSKDVTVTTTDTDLSVNIQALLEVLVALVAKLDVL